MRREKYDPFTRALACLAAKRLPRYVALLTRMLRRPPTDAELATLYLKVPRDIPQ